MSDKLEQKLAGDQGEGPKSNVVSIPQEQFNSLMERIERLEKGDSRPKVVKPKYYTARVWFLDDEKKQLVVGYGKNREDRRPDGSTYMSVEIFYKDGEETKSKWLPWIDFRNSGKYEVGKILEIKPTEEVKQDGYTTLKNVDYENYKTIDTGIEVPMEVTTVIRNYKIELPNGQVVELNESALN